MIRLSLLILAAASAFVGHIFGKFLYEQFPNYGVTGVWFGYFWAVNATLFTTINSRLVSRTGLVLLATVPIFAYFLFAMYGVPSNLFGLDLKKPGTGFQWPIVLGVFDVIQIPVLSTILLIILLIPLRTNAIDAGQFRVIMRWQLAITSLSIIFYFCVLAPFGSQHRSSTNEEWAFVTEFEKFPCRIFFKQDVLYGSVLTVLILDKNLKSEELRQLIDQLVDKVPRTRPVVIKIRTMAFDVGMLQKLGEIKNLCRIRFPDECISELQFSMVKGSLAGVDVNGVLLE